MSTKPEKREFDWGDGHVVVVKKPKLKEIPGDSMVCPVPCYPVGEDDAQWKENEEKTRKRPLRRRPRR